MTCAATRPDREGARTRPQNPPLLPGDVVTLKTLPDLPFTIQDQHLIDGEKYPITRVAEGGRSRVELTVSRCEILTALRHKPLAIAVELPDDGPDPAVSVAEAERRTADEEKARIVWGPEDSRGNCKSACGRFDVVQVGGKYGATDWSDFEASPNFALKADAIDWCERRVREDARTAAPDATAAGLVDVPGIEWEEGGARDEFVCRSKCRRFVVYQKRDEYGEPDPKGFWTHDTHSADGLEDSSPRWSPDGLLDDAKEWAEDRAGEPKTPVPVPDDRPF